MTYTISYYSMLCYVLYYKLFSKQVMDKLSKLDAEIVVLFLRMK